jgi:ribonuclease inhibitor
MDLDERRALVEIDRAEITWLDKLHDTLARALEFPDFYGKNWNAFWDAITSLIPMPRHLRFVAGAISVQIGRTMRS